MLHPALVLVLGVLAVSAAQALVEPTSDPLCDWSDWSRFRAGVRHPAGTVTPADLDRARRNQAAYPWARKYVENLVAGSRPWLDRLTPAFLERLIPVTTPGDSLFTPCPACRDQRQPFQSHGLWQWSLDDPDHLTCQVCRTVFPNAQYPESLVFTTRHGTPQTLTFYGGPPIPIFGFECRPSFTGCLRARQVGLLASTTRRLAETYALTGDPVWAGAVRQLLLRFATVYPGWLVHTGYGEYADCPPHVAAFNLAALPNDEITPTPKGPDRQLHSRFWQGGRATGTGMEGGFVRQMVEAYTLTCLATVEGRQVFSEEERLRIERDLLLESTVLLVADKQINNKSVTNATAVALVGMVLGHPGLVRFGLDAFLKTVDGWFLPDGATSESWDYANMTLSGIEALGQAFRGYSDPPGYRDAKGQRLDGFDLYHDTAYQRVWEAMFNALQGNLKYPPAADGYRTGGLSVRWAEMLAANYPDEPRYLALLRELAGPDLAQADPAAALYWREPGRERQETAPLAFADHHYPNLNFGQLRSGPTGRDSFLLLSASDWGNHHHLDSLNLSFQQQGQELLSDLGYLWDHPDKHHTVRTLAHNTVMIDGADQVTRGRGGAFTLFGAAGSVKAMEAESKAYGQATLYRRTVAQVEPVPGRRYLIDVFRVAGGKVHDYLFHGPHQALTIDGPPRAPVTLDPPLELAELRGSAEPAPWRLTWQGDAPLAFSAQWPAEPGVTAAVGDGWGQRDYRNKDVGARLPYVVRRVPAGPEPTVFVTVFEGHPPGAPLVRAVRRLPVAPADADGTVAVAVETSLGWDLLVSNLSPRRVAVTTDRGTLVLDGRLAMVLLRTDQRAEAQALDGTVEWRARQPPRSAL